jgi:nicotinamidase-related amidase
MPALLLVDLQNDYFPGGALPLEGIEAAAANARLALDAFRSRGLPVVHVQHLTTRPGATFFLPGTPGSEIHATLAPTAGEPVVQKHFPNAFRGTGLEPMLRDQAGDGLLIAGAMSHMCIDATVRAAFDLGFGCTVLADACATRALEWQGRTVAAAEVHAAFMAALRVPYANVTTTGAALAA